MAKPRKLLEQVVVGGKDYEHVAAAQTAQSLGATGGKGDHLARLVVSVVTSATGTVAIKDGSNAAHTVVPANTPIGTYTIHLGIDSVVGAWQVTTGAGAECLAIGDFT